MEGINPSQASSEKGTVSDSGELNTQNEVKKEDSVVYGSETVEKKSFKTARLSKKEKKELEARKAK